MNKVFADAAVVPKDEVECSHRWVANSGQGGEPVFKANRMISAEPVMHVACSICGSRTWMTKAQFGRRPKTAA